MLLHVNDPSDPGRIAFREGLRALGWIEGQNYVLELRFAEGQADRFPAFAAELVKLKVDVIVTAGPPPTRAAKDATTTIPIVMATHGDPVGRGVVASLARPGGNITGLSSMTEDLETKRLELLKASVPQAVRVAYLSEARVTNVTHGWCGAGSARQPARSAFGSSTPGRGMPATSTPPSRP
jgi:ABC-type uncharacterized transport system substrate-binding protein